jgi:hypothetical protein
VWQHAASLDTVGWLSVIKRKGLVRKRPVFKSLLHPLAAVESRTACLPSLSEIHYDCTPS